MQHYWWGEEKSRSINRNELIPYDQSWTTNQKIRDVWIKKRTELTRDA